MCVCVCVPGAAVALHVGRGRVLAGLGVDSVGPGERIPHKAGRSGEKRRRGGAGDDRVLVMGRPADAVGRVVEVPVGGAFHPSFFEVVDPVGLLGVVDLRFFLDLAHVIRVAVAVARQPLETPGRIPVVRVAEDVFNRMRGRQEVIGARALEFDQAECGFLPGEAVRGRGQAKSRAVFDEDGFDAVIAFGGGIGDKAGRVAAGSVPHFEALFRLIVIHVVDGVVGALPGAIDRDDGVARDFLRRVERPAGVLQAFDQIVVDKKLPGRADIDQGHLDPLPPITLRLLTTWSDHRTRRV